MICSQNTINGARQSVRSFMDPEDLYLLDDFKANAEAVREAISRSNPGIIVDDMPYVTEVARDTMLDLYGEYQGIFDMYEEKRVSARCRLSSGSSPQDRDSQKPFRLRSRTGA